MKKKDVRSMKLTMQLKTRSYDIILNACCLANLHQFTNLPASARTLPSTPSPRARAANA